MTANNIGKTLVLINLALSLLFLALGLSIFLQQLDWGWKEPRKDVTGTARLASEIDQRTAAVNDALKAIELVRAPLKNAADNLAQVEAGPWFAANHLWYRDTLADLRSSSRPLDVKEIKYNKGALVLDGRALGRPVLQDSIGLVKSYEAYGRDLVAVQKEIDQAQKDIKDLVAEEQKLTYQVSGKDNAGKDVGILALLEKEHQLQVRLKFEKDYLLPRWVGALDEVDLFLERRQRLDATLEKLKKARTESGGP
jgi:hypothetical protein